MKQSIKFKEDDNELQLKLETDPRAKTQRLPYLQGYETNYYRIAADYNAWSRNSLEGDLIRPEDLPALAPSLSEMKSQVCQ